MRVAERVCYAAGILTPSESGDSPTIWNDRFVDQHFQAAIFRQLKSDPTLIGGTVLEKTKCLLSRCHSYFGVSACLGPAAVIPRHLHTDATVTTLSDWPDSRIKTSRPAQGKRKEGSRLKNVQDFDRAL